MNPKHDDGTRPEQATTVSLTAPAGREALTFRDGAGAHGPPELMGHYRALRDERRLSWVEQHRMVRRLGSGGQGVVYLGERVGADGFALPVALKFFSPEGYDDVEAYDAAMARMAQVAVRIALIQQDNLIDVHNLA